MELNRGVTSAQLIADKFIEKLKNDELVKMVLSNNGDESMLQDDYSDNMSMWIEAMYDSI